MCESLLPCHCILTGGLPPPHQNTLIRWSNSGFPARLCDRSWSLEWLLLNRQQYTCWTGREHVHWSNAMSMRWTSKRVYNVMAFLIHYIATKLYWSQGYKLCKVCRNWFQCWKKVCSERYMWDILLLLFSYSTVLFLPV